MSLLLILRTSNSSRRQWTPWTPTAEQWGCNTTLPSKHVGIISNPPIRYWTKESGAAGGWRWHTLPLYQKWHRANGLSWIVAASGSTQRGYKRALIRILATPASGTDLKPNTGKPFGFASVNIHKRAGENIQNPNSWRTNVTNDLLFSKFSDVEGHAQNTVQAAWAACSMLKWRRHFVSRITWSGRVRGPGRQAVHG